MKRCWTDGELRACLDRELPEWERVTAHLQECAECSKRYAAITARAERVSALVAMMPVALTANQSREHKRSQRRTPILIGAGLALAAALAAGLVMMPRPRPAVLAPVVHVNPTVLQAHVDPGAQVMGVRHGARRAGRRRAKATADVKYFLALDDQPIETGMVVRVSLGGDDTQADVIVGSDGRARAIRIVNDN